MAERLPIPQEPVELAAAFPISPVRPLLAVLDDAAIRGQDIVFRIEQVERAGSVTVHVETKNGSAIAGSDYTAFSADVLVPEEGLEISVPTMGATQDGDELFTLHLSSAGDPVRFERPGAFGLIRGDGDEHVYEVGVYDVGVYQ